MEQLNNILQLPPKSLLNKKLTKAFFKRNFPLTLTERKLLDDAGIIQQMELVASIKPNNSNIAAYADETYIFEEIEIITIKLECGTAAKNGHKVIDLIQKYIPYPILLILYDTTGFLYNTASKRVNLKENGKRTIETCLTTPWMQLDHLTSYQQLFLQQCAFEWLDKQNLQTCYQSYETNIASLQVAAITGIFTTRPIERAKADVLKMEALKRLEMEVAIIKKKAATETQLNTQVTLNNLVLALQQKIKALTLELHH